VFQQGRAICWRCPGGIGRKGGGLLRRLQSYDVALRRQCAHSRPFPGCFCAGTHRPYHRDNATDISIVWRGAWVYHSDSFSVRSLLCPQRMHGRIAPNIKLSLTNSGTVPYVVCCGSLSHIRKRLPGVCSSGPAPKLTRTTEFPEDIAKACIARASGNEVVNNALQEEFLCNF